jgi:DNA-binding winged helix-turn-helix (wHTH) protein
MIFSFNEFQFDSDQITLTKAGKVVQLSEKPAQMLRLFLLEANQIHSKAKLLETIWPDRVVTEQVIFQNISLLRALFGDDAIKTFPKKGYQWQLPLTIVEKKEVTPQKGYSKSEHLADKQSFPNFFYSHSRIFVALRFRKVFYISINVEIY